MFNKVSTDSEPFVDTDTDSPQAEKILQKMAERNQAKQESRRLDAFGNPKSEHGSDAESEGGIQFGEEEGGEGQEDGGQSDED